jgi:uncharacterized membrane protein YvlD (DUF360 family)
MKLVAHWIFAIIVNLVGLWAADRYISGFSLSGTHLQIFLVGLGLSLLTIILRPILKIVLAPVILLTLGLGIIIVYVILLYLLDNFTAHLTILSVRALFESAILIGLINFLLHLIPV